jgi:hypothetical protein
VSVAEYERNFLYEIPLFDEYECCLACFKVCLPPTATLGDLITDIKTQISMEHLKQILNRRRGKVKDCTVSRVTSTFIQTFSRESSFPSFLLTCQDTDTRLNKTDALSFIIPDFLDEIYFEVFCWKRTKEGWGLFSTPYATPLSTCVKEGIFIQLQVIFFFSFSF